MKLEDLLVSMDYQEGCQARENEASKAFSNIGFALSLTVLPMAPNLNGVNHPEYTSIHGNRHDTLEWCPNEAKLPIVFLVT